MSRGAAAEHFPQLGLPKGALTVSKALVTRNGSSRARVPRGMSPPGSPSLQGLVPLLEKCKHMSLACFRLAFSIANKIAFGVL